MIHFSLGDLGRILARGKLLILLAALLCGSIVFLYLVTRPVHYTVRGIFKGNPPQSTNALFKALELLGNEENQGSNEDHRSLLRSYPVIEKVVLTHNLQATLIEPKMARRLREVWYTVKTSLAYHRLKQERPTSSILRKEILIADELVVPDFTPSLFCNQLDYGVEIGSKFSIRFTSATAYKVKSEGKWIGHGSLESPFIWEKGSFTLSGKGRKGKTVLLHLIPSQEAIASLQKSLQIMRDKENQALIHISYTHRDRRLAALIVNAVMEEFQNYLTQDGKRKISKQLTYLHQRQEEMMEQLETLLQQQKGYLEAHLDSGLILSLDKELDFLANTQAEKRHKLLAIQSEIDHLAPGANFREFAGQKLQTHALSVESAHEMIQFHQKELDQLSLDSERYEECLLKLAEPGFDCSSLAKVLSDPSLQSRFERMHSLHHRLIDEKNWSLKEREQLKSELEIEKAFLKEHTHLLKEGALLHIQSIQNRIETLHHDLLYLLADRYQQEERALASLTAQTQDFPEKWLNEQKMNLTSKLSKEIMESITKMIEAKNLGYNLDYLMAQVVKPAIPPILPDSPYLMLGSCLGLSVGAFSMIIGLILFALWKGPSASFANLAERGRR